MTESPASHAVHHHPDLSIDQQLALRAAAGRLQDEFGDQIGMDTIETFLHSSYDHFAARARIPNFVPLLAERFARQQLHAVALLEGNVGSGKPTVKVAHLFTRGTDRERQTHCGSTTLNSPRPCRARPLR